MANPDIDKKVIGSVFKRIGTLLELSGENEFKIRAYFQGARIVEKYPGNLEALVRDALEDKIKGIGKALAEKLDTLVQTGDLPYLAELEGSFPAGLTELLDIPGLGPKTVRKLHQSLAIETLGDLEKACASGKILEQPGFSEKSRQKILEGIRSHRSYEGRYRLHSALETAESIIHALASAAEKAEAAGSVRRRRETVRDIDIVVLGADPGRIVEALRALPDFETVEENNPDRSRFRFHSGLACEVFTSSPQAFGAILAWHTGSAEHVDRLRSRADGLGLTFGETGLFTKDHSPVPTPDEAAFFRALALDFIPPEIRENDGEIDAAARHALPVLVEMKDLRGVIHAHTQYSDGAAGLPEMAAASKRLGFSYLAVSDHSKSSTIAGGMKEDAIKRQHDEIDAWNEKNPDFRILKGIECDILKDGSLDYPDRVLALFDFIIASVHSNFQMNREDMTARVARAAGNPYTAILGHPTGRILLHREPYRLDMDKVLEACAASGCAVEINANPYRLDLDWRLVKRAIGAGIKLAVCPDAHSEGQLDFTKFGVDVARKGWATAGDVLNTLDADGFLRFAKHRSSGA